MKELSKFFIFILAICYALYTGQIIFFVSILAYYMIGLFLIKVILSPHSKEVYFLYDLFFVIYGYLVLFSQVELIHNPETDYYIHNDASDSFYKAVISYILPCDYSELYDKTIANPQFVHYPLAAFIMGFMGKLGLVLEVDNLRLFLRIHIFTIGAFIIGIIANLLYSKGLSPKTIIKNVVVFGLISFLLISSAIFTRDIYVTLIYTLGTYVMLKDDINKKILWFVSLFLIALGLRPESGLLFLVYPFCYYFNTFKSQMGKMSIIIFLFIFVGLMFLLSELIITTSESVAGYSERNAEMNAGGMYAMISNLPFPINTIMICIYMLMMPLPMFAYCLGDGGTFLNLPNVLSPYLWFTIVTTCCYYLFYYKKQQKNNIIKVAMITSIIVFVAIIQASPHIRRGFNALPGLFICYCLVLNKVPYKIRKQINHIGWSVIAAINIFFLWYLN